jgi:serine/threonine-protein kinase
VAKHLEEEAPNPRSLNPEVPEQLAAVILKAMAKDPSARFASASDMHDALARIG